MVNIVHGHPGSRGGETLWSTLFTLVGSFTLETYVDVSVFVCVFFYIEQNLDRLVFERYSVITYTSKFEFLFLLDI